MSLIKATASIGNEHPQPLVHRRDWVWRIAAGMLAAIVFVPAAMASPVAYTSLTTFNAALPGASTTVDFDSATAGTTISSGGSIDGLGLSYSLGGVLLAVTDGSSFGAAASAASTTSASNFLGTNDLDHLQDGDTLTLSFAAGSGVGLYILTRDPMENGDVTLSAGGATALLLASAVEQTLADGSSVYFLGVLDAAGSISSAVLDFPSDGETNFLMNVDDVILVPEPGQLLMLLPGIASLAGLSLRRSRRRASLANEAGSRRSRSGSDETGEPADSRKRSGDV